MRFHGLFCAVTTLALGSVAALGQSWSVSPLPLTFPNSVGRDGTEIEPLPVTVTSPDGGPFSASAPANLATFLQVSTQSDCSGDTKSLSGVPSQTTFYLCADSSFVTGMGNLVNILTLKSPTSGSEIELPVFITVTPGSDISLSISAVTLDANNPSMPVTVTMRQNGPQTIGVNIPFVGDEGPWLKTSSNCTLPLDNIATCTVTITADATQLKSGTSSPSTFNSLVAIIALNTGSEEDVAVTYNYAKVAVPLTITSSNLSGTAGTPLSITLTASGGVPPYTWQGSNLPSWLTVSTSGVLSAQRPVAGGPYNLTIHVTDSTGVQTSQSVTLTIQAGPSTVSQFFPHLADGGSKDTWQTEFLLINENASPVNASLVFHMDLPATALPIAVPALGVVSQTGKVTIPPNGSYLFRTSGLSSSSLVVGWAEIQSSLALSGQALFRRHAPDGNYYEGAVPLVSSAPTSFQIPFDGTSYTTASGGSVAFLTGVAFANPNSGASTTVSCSAYDANGDLLGANLPLTQVPAFGHTQMVLENALPVLGTNRGLLACNSTQLVGLLGLRFFGAYALSSVPITTTSH
jgi:hypothetical protein